MRFVHSVCICTEHLDSGLARLYSLICDWALLGRSFGAFGQDVLGMLLVAVRYHGRSWFLDPPLVLEANRGPSHSHEHLVGRQTLELRGAPGAVFPLDERPEH